MPSDAAIPTVPFLDLKETIAFYAHLGFEPKSVQHSPIPYAVLTRQGAEIHFYRHRDLDPETAYGGCIVETDDVAALHATFTDGLRRGLGAVPFNGRPRITRLRRGQTRFSVVDPSGNWVLFASRDEEGYEDEASDAGLSPSAKALRTARRLRDFCNDPAAAAKVLDTALRKASEPQGVDHARILIWRAELAYALRDEARAASCLDAYSGLDLEDVDRVSLEPDLVELAATRAALRDAVVGTP